MINITSDFESILNSLRDRSATLKQEHEELKDEQGGQADLIKNIILDRKSQVDAQINRLYNAYYDNQHHNLVFLTDEELDRLCGG